MKRIPPVAGLLILAASIGLCDEKNSRPPKSPPASGAARSGDPGNPAPKAPGRVNNPLNPLQRFLNMTPDEQERVLEKAPPAQRQRLTEALERWKARPEAQKQFAYRQYQSLAKLPPEKQAILQRQMNAFNGLPADRIKPVRQELIRLLRMPPDQRPARFAAEEFTANYSPEEQQILKDLSTNLPDDYPLAGR